MKTMVFTLFIVILASGSVVSGQNPQPIQYADPVSSIAGDLAKIATSVQLLNGRLKEFVDKFEKVGGLSLSEKQERLIMGLEILVRTEQRLATLQKFQIELVEKQGTTRARLAQVERDASPQSIDRSVAFEGTTKAEEMRESRRNTLHAERLSLQALMAQINSNLADANEATREALLLVQRLRRTFLPQIERELADQ